MQLGLGKHFVKGCSPKPAERGVTGTTGGPEPNRRPKCVAPASLTLYRRESPRSPNRPHASYRGPPTNSESYFSLSPPRSCLDPCSDPYFSLLCPQLDELLEGPLQTSRHVCCDHLAGLGPDNLGGVDRPPRDEDERPGRRTDLALADQQEKLFLENVEQVIATVVNMARWPGPRGARRLQIPDRAS
jgi:hypothetical protein